MFPDAILRDVLKAQNLSVKDLSLRSGIHEVVLLEVLEGNWPITDVVAHGLSRATSTSIGFWHQVQRSFDNSTMTVALPGSVVNKPLP